MTTWIKALKQWNDKKGGAWCVPRKGSEEYNEVKKIMEDLKKPKPAPKKKIKLIIKNKEKEPEPEKKVAFGKPFKPIPMTDALKEVLTKALDKSRPKKKREED
jgi:hypothetical protein